MACAYCYVPRRKRYANPRQHRVAQLTDCIAATLPECGIRYAC